MSTITWIHHDGRIVSRIKQGHGSLNRHVHVLELDENRPQDPKTDAWIGICCRAENWAECGNTVLKFNFAVLFGRLRRSMNICLEQSTTKYELPLHIGAEECGIVRGRISWCLREETLSKLESYRPIKCGVLSLAGES